MQTEIKQLRKDAGLTQKQAAELIDRKISMYKYYENGKHKMPAILLAEFKRKLGELK